MTIERPLRILHVNSALSLGGIETWLVHVLRHIDRERFRMDFLVHTDQPCAHDEQVRGLGSSIVPCLDPSTRPLAYARNFKRILRERGPYDIVHSDIHHFSGYVLRLAHQAGVPVRIAHSHTDTSPVDGKAGMSRLPYLHLMKRWIDRHATVGLAASRQAASALFGAAWEADPRWRLLYYGIDLEPFRASVDRVGVRAELGIPAGAFVVGHAGRFYEQKNHAFLVDIAAEIAKREPNMRLLLLGDGPLRSVIEHRVADMGMTDKVIFTGGRSDVTRLMLGAMDVFVLPSFYEGLPLAGIEAQAAGLPIVLSDIVTKEMDVVRPLVRRLSLSQSASIWAEATMAGRSVTNGGNRPDALTLLEQSHLNIRQSVMELEDVYARSGFAQATG